MARIRKGPKTSQSSKTLDRASSLSSRSPSPVRSRRRQRRGSSAKRVRYASIPTDSVPSQSDQSVSPHCRLEAPPDAQEQFTTSKGALPASNNSSTASLQPRVRNESDDSSVEEVIRDPPEDPSATRRKAHPHSFLLDIVLPSTLREPVKEVISEDDWFKNFLKGVAQEVRHPSQR